MSFWFPPIGSFSSDFDNRISSGSGSNIVRNLVVFEEISPFTDEDMKKFNLVLRGHYHEHKGVFKVVCSYCGRKYSRMYDECPGCGAQS